MQSLIKKWGVLIGLVALLLLALWFDFTYVYPTVQAQYSGPGTAPLVFDHMEHDITRMYDSSTNVVCYLFPGDGEHDKVCLALEN